MGKLLNRIVHAHISARFIVENQFHQTKLFTYILMYMYMGQILQDGKKVLEMSSTYLHSKSRQAQTVGPGTLSF